MTLLERFKNIKIHCNTTTIIVISIIIIFTIFYVLHTKSTEGFTQYNVNSGDLVSLSNLNNIVVGGNDTPLPTEITNIIDTYNSNTLNNTFAKTSDLASTNTSLTTLTNTVNDTVSRLTALSTKTTTDLNTINQLISSTTSTLNNNIGSIPPPLSIIAYYGTTAPSGWQLCTGTPLIAMDNSKVLKPDGNDFLTPDLRNRFITGAGSNYILGTTGGLDTVTLNTTQMPSHTHNLAFGTNGTTSGIKGWQGVSSNGTLSGWMSSEGVYPAGGDQPHENRPPYMALTYIIKKPLTGGIQ